MMKRFGLMPLNNINTLEEFYDEMTPAVVSNKALMAENLQGGSPLGHRVGGHGSSRVESISLRPG